MERNVELGGSELSGERRAALNKILTDDYKSKLTKDEQLLLTIHPFYNGVSINHKPKDHHELFEAFIREQDFERSSALTGSLLMLSKGGASRVRQFCVAYTSSELTTFFASMQSVFQKYNIDFPVGLILENTHHALTVGYDQKYGWIFIEADEGRARKCSINELVGKVNGALSKNDNIIASTSLYSLGRDRKKMIGVVEDWERSSEYKEINNITSERAQYMDSDGATLMHHAATLGDVDLIIRLLVAGGEANVADNRNMTPISSAAKVGRIEVVEKLLQRFSGSGDELKSAQSAFELAEYMGHKGLMKILNNFINCTQDAEIKKSNRK